MGKLKNNKATKNQRGMSIIEILPIVAVIATLFSFLLGSWGIAHKSALSSIAARTYAFDTFNNRANLMYFSDIRSINDSYEATGLRYHGVGSSQPDQFSAPIVPIRYVANVQGGALTGANELHTQRIWDEDTFDRQREIDPNNLGNLNHVWVTVGHGICLNTNCGD
jgi:type II secretory pathway pseudopilin PulG